MSWDFSPIAAKGLTVCSPQGPISVFGEVLGRRALLFFVSRGGAWRSCRHSRKLFSREELGLHGPVFPAASDRLEQELRDSRQFLLEVEIGRASKLGDLRDAMLVYDTLPAPRKLKADSEVLADR
jgi:hypothetical protein